MVATVISAPPRTGKSLYTMEILEKAVIDNPDRLIYTNIIGCKLPGVLPAVSRPDSPFDWRTLPNGALYVHDEAHEHPAFCKNDLLKDKELISRVPYDEFIRLINDYEQLTTDQKTNLLTVLKVINQYPELPLSLKVKEKESLVRLVKDAYDKNNLKRKEEILDIGRALTMHGHFGIDIYFITQRPTLLNEHVRASISEHIILRRLFKMNFAIIYNYAELQENFGMMTRKNAITTRFWRYPKHLYKYYVSAESHPKSNFPKLWYAVALLPIFLMAGGYKYTMDFFGPKETIATVPVVQNELPKQPLLNADNQQKDLNDLCRSAVNLDKPECKKYIQEITNKGLSIAPVNVYDPAKPYDVEYTVQDFEPKDFPRFKNAIVYNGKCTAYSQQGTIMHNVSTKDCFRLANGDRPFDYFYEGEQTSNRSNSSISTPVIPASQNQETAQTINPNPQVFEQPLPIDAKPLKAITGAHTL